MAVKLLSLLCTAGLAASAATAAAEAPAEIPPSAPDFHADRHPRPEPTTPRPVALEMGYTSDIWSVIDGGLDRRTRYLDNLDLTVAADAEALGGPQNTRLFAYLLYNNGASFSAGGVGDAQIVSNIETGVRALRLYEAWIEHESGSVSAKFGLYDLNSEFDVLEHATLFLGSAHGIGTDIAQSGHNGPSIFPSTALALRLQVKAREGLMFRAAVLDGVPGDPYYPRRTAIRLGRRDGALLISEADWTQGGLRVLAGHWRYTARFEDAWATSVTDTPVRRRGNHGFYLRAEAQLARLGDAGHLGGFVRAGKAAGRFNMFDRFASAGLTWSGLVRQFPDDQLGLAVAVAKASRTYRAITAQRGEWLRRREVSLELSCRHVLSPRFSVQPDLQYVINPDLRDGRNALVGGIRFEVALHR